MKKLYNAIMAAWNALLSILIENINKQESKKAAAFRAKYEQAKKDPALYTALLADSISNMTGKLKNIRSIGTSVIYNARCKARALNPNSICHYCYAAAQLATSRGRNLALKLERNTLLWCSEIIPVELMPVINDRIFRFESFGDLINTIQFINYIHMARRNPKTMFSIWTKNPDIMQLVFKMTAETKPENMVIIFSDETVNGSGQKRINAILKKYTFIDKVFTVYRPDYVKEHKNIIINCRQPGNYTDKICITCNNSCYEKNNTVYVNEIIK